MIPRSVITKTSEFLLPVPTYIPMDTLGARSFLLRDAITEPHKWDPPFSSTGPLERGLSSSTYPVPRQEKGGMTWKPNQKWMARVDLLFQLELQFAEESTTLTFYLSHSNFDEPIGLMVFYWGFHQVHFHVGL